MRNARHRVSLLSDHCTNVFPLLNSGADGAVASASETDYCSPVVWVMLVVAAYGGGLMFQHHDSKKL